MALGTVGQTFELPRTVCNALPSGLVFELEGICRRAGKKAEEIRLRCDRRTELVFSDAGVLCTHISNKKEIEDIFFRFCGGAIYAHSDTVCRGFIRAGEGVRVGVCGRAVTDKSGKSITAVHDIASLNIRLPCTVFPDVSELVSVFDKYKGGMLIYSPPGVGKTTALRSMIKTISGKCGIRSSVIDTRGELMAGLEGSELRLDVLDGYPRGDGIEIAVRAMNPRVVFCDEIGSSEDINAILSVSGCGVPIIASAHGDSTDALLSRTGFSQLHSAGIFLCYIGLKRNGNRYYFDTTERNQIKMGRAHE